MPDYIDVHDSVTALPAETAAALDPGIRQVVTLLREAGFETTDSGDGRSKPAEWYESGEAMSFPHVVAVVSVDAMVAEAHRMACVLGRGWVVEATYSTAGRTAILFARMAEEGEINDAP